MTHKRPSKDDLIAFECAYRGASCPPDLTAHAMWVYQQTIYAIERILFAQVVCNVKSTRHN